MCHSAIVYTHFSAMLNVGALVKRAFAFLSEVSTKVAANNTKVSCH